MGTRQRISGNIAYLRKREGFSQEVFAEKIGIKRSTLSSYEEYRAVPNYDLLIKICNFFGVSISDMILEEMRVLDSARTDNKP